MVNQYIPDYLNNKVTRKMLHAMMGFPLPKEWAKEYEEDKKKYLRVIYPTTEKPSEPNRNTIYTYASSTEMSSSEKVIYL
jgi:hypothetical protein